MLLGFLIADFTKPGDLIIDPYAGSCSTLIAARASGRYAVGIELDASYIGPAIARLKETA
jgi:site-specific DNA-methyltransferase (adenine-specific)